MSKINSIIKKSITIQEARINYSVLLELSMDLINDIFNYTHDYLHDKKPTTFNKIRSYLVRIDNTLMAVNGYVDEMEGLQMDLLYSEVGHRRRAKRTINGLLQSADKKMRKFKTKKDDSLILGAFGDYIMSCIKIIRSYVKFAYSINVFGEEEKYEMHLFENKIYKYLVEINEISTGKKYPKGKGRSLYLPKYYDRLG